MRDFFAYTLAVSFLLLFSAATSYAQKEDDLLAVYDKEICEGGAITLDGSIYQKRNSNCTIFSIKANGQSEELKDKPYISPSQTTTYTIIYGESESAPQQTTNFTITVIEKPRLSVTVDNQQEIYCSNDKLTLTANVHPAGLDVHWVVSTDRYAKEAIYSGTGTALSPDFSQGRSLWVICQAYNSCGEVEVPTYFNVRPNPDLTNAELILDTEVSGNFCLGCGYAANVADILKGVRINGVTIDDAVISEPSMVWSGSDNLEEITIDATNVSKQVDVTAKVTWQSVGCGGATAAVKQLKVERHPLRISGIDCKPTVQNSVSLKPCRAGEVQLRNRYSAFCTVQGTPVLTTDPVHPKITIAQNENFPYQSADGTLLYRWKTSWEDYSPTDASPSLVAQASYTIACPYSKKNPSITDRLEERVKVTIDTNYITFKYEYCPDDIADLEIKGDKDVITIEQVELNESVEDFLSLFEEQPDSEPHLKKYKSKLPLTATVLEQYPYKPLNLRVLFKVDEGSCHFSSEKKESLNPKDKGNCTMQFVMDQTGPCIGEARTLKLENAPEGLQVDSIVLSPHPVFVFAMKDITAAAPLRRMFVPYYAGAPAVASQADSIEATAYYRLGNSVQLSLYRKFGLKVDACPPAINDAVRINQSNCPVCPGAEMRGTVSFRNTTTREKDVRVDVVSTFANIKGDREIYSAVRREYLIERYVLRDMDYHIEVNYNEGDSLYAIPRMTYRASNAGESGYGEIVTTESIRMANICGLGKEASKDTVCKGQSIDLYVYSQNFLYDTLKSIVWSDPSVKPVGTGLESWGDYQYADDKGTVRTKTIKRFHYRVEKAEGPGIYPFVLRTKIRDSLVERQDTLRVVVLDKQRIFIQDTVYACENTPLDASIYVDTLAVDLNEISPADRLDIASVIKSEVLVVSAPSLYCANTTLTDSLVVIGEVPVYGVANADETEYCPGEPIRLMAGTNGRITWIKWRKFEGGGLSAPDTLCVNAPGNAVIRDTMGAETCRYRFEARTGCPIPGEYVQIVEVASKPVPKVEIIDNSVCFPDSLVLQTEPFLASEVADSASAVKWYVDGKPYTLPTVPPADSIRVRCEATGINGCSGSNEKILYSYKLPEIHIGIYDDPDFTDKVYCAAKNDNVRFTGMGADTYSWSMASNPGVEISTAGDYILNAVADDTLYLVGTESLHSCSTKDSIVIVLEPDSYVEKSDTIACLGEDFNIRIFRGTAENTVMTDPAGVIYPDFDCNCPLGIVNYDAGDTGVFVFTFTRKGCTINKEVHLRMFPIPQFEFGDTVFCEDDLLRLDVNTGLEPEWIPQSRFVWKKDGNELYNKVGESAYTGNELSLSDSGFYNLEIYVDRCINQDSVRIYVDARSHPAFTVDSFYCEGADFVTRAEDQGEGAVYEWYSVNRQDMEASAQTQLNIEGLTMEDSAYLTLTVYRGACVDDTSIFIHVRSLPRPELVAVGALQDEQGLFYCEGMPMRLDVPDVRTGDRMEWYHNGVLIEGLSVKTYGVSEISLDDGGIYTFKVARNGCYGESSLYVDVHPMPLPLVNDTFICSGYVLELDAANPDYPGATFRWEESGTAGSLVEINAGGSYSVAMSYEGCDGSKSFWVEERPTPQIGFPADTVMCQRDSILLTGPDTVDFYCWQDESKERSYLVKEEGLYSLYVERDGCFDYAEVYVAEDFCSNLYFPSAFTPNGDGINDFFGPITTAVDEQVVYSLYIYNRNGEKVFESHSLNDGWDGKFKGARCPAGMYVYRCKAHARKNGRNLSTEGTVHLIR